MGRDDDEYPKTRTYMGRGSSPGDGCLPVRDREAQRVSMKENVSRQPDSLGGRGRGHENMYVLVRPVHFLGRQLDGVPDPVAKNTGHTVGDST